ncbi:hypothetical protein AQUCO_02000060v1 [Aquilegia coerulea]|uniref:Uncharacterized protein n=1 Tax=Aquilegia coerulea TaxID=218851 RepID=A0A2G5DFP4_AQUCA|nr:hypothetical protein AQUCO_02000060v1 [Aquilegia coerulea]
MSKNKNGDDHFVFVDPLEEGKSRREGVVVVMEDYFGVKVKTQGEGSGLRPQAQSNIVTKLSKYYIVRIYKSSFTNNLHRNTLPP